MVAQPVTWVDVESAVRAWARDYVTSVARKVFFAVRTDLSYPQVTVHRIGGPDDNCLMQFDCWGANKAAAAQLAAEVATEIDALPRYATDTVILHGAAVDSVRWFPDPESDQARYIVDATFTATATAATGS